MARRILTAYERVAIWREAADEERPRLEDLIGEVETGNGRWHYPYSYFSPNTFSGYGMHNWEVAPANAPAVFDGESYGRKKRFYYDPARVTVENGEFRPQVNHPEGAVFRLEDDPDTDLLWRGMSNEEYEKAKELGYFETNGSYNLGPEQDGKTFFSTQRSSASTYANGFAPWQYTPTFDRPAHVVGIPNRPDVPRGPLGDDPKSHEVGISGRIPFSEVSDHWVGNVAALQPGEWTGTSDPNYSDINPPSRSLSPGAQLHWERDSQFAPRTASRRLAIRFDSPGHITVTRHSGDEARRLAQEVWGQDGPDVLWSALSNADPDEHAYIARDSAGTIHGVGLGEFETDQDGVPFDSDDSYSNYLRIKHLYTSLKAPIMQDAAGHGIETGHHLMVNGAMPHTMDYYRHLGVSEWGGDRKQNGYWDNNSQHALLAGDSIPGGAVPDRYDHDLYEPVPRESRLPGSARGLRAAQPVTAPRTASRRIAMPYYHNTDVDFGEGDELKPPTVLDGGNSSGRWGDDYRPNRVYFTWADEDGDLDPDELIFGENTYEVEPIGEIERDPEDRKQIYNDWMAPGARVVRKVNATRDRLPHVWRET